MMSERLAPFSDPRAVARYADGSRRMVPGFADLQRMAMLLLSERTPARADVLVLGAGGGLELKAFAEAQPSWSFVGVDPAAEMLNLAEKTLGPLAPRARLHHGYINDAPDGPYDGATCLLTLHFVDVAERGRTLVEVRRRLKPGAPFVVAHLSMPEGRAERATWLARYSAFAGLEAEQANNVRAAIEARLHVLSAEQDEGMLRDAGFQNVSLFYAGFAFRGWVANA